MNVNSGAPVLETSKLTKFYGKSRGIIDVDLTVQSGEIFGFIGPNGAGKSTAIRTILGLLFPDSGTVRLFGEDAAQHGASVRRRIGFVPAELNYYDGVTTGQLLNYAADLLEVDGQQIIAEYSERLKLDLKRRISDLSLGNRKKVAIIQALVHLPELLILDEPTSGLDPLIQSRFYDILREEQSRGATIFFSSHTLSEVERLCSRVGIIREGRMMTVSGIDQLKQLYLKRFRLVFEHHAGYTLSELESLFPQASDIRAGTRGAEGLYGGDVRELMRGLSKIDISDAVIEDPGLEDIFMHYYDENEASP